MKRLGSLSLIGLSLGAVAWQAGLEPAEVPQETAEAARPASMAPVPEDASFDVPVPLPSSYAAVEQRILFHPDRRLPARPVEAPAAEEEPPARAPTPSLHLVGTFTSATVRLALVRVDGETVPITVRPGDQVEGWTVVAVASDEVAVESAGGLATKLVLRRKRQETNAQPRNPFVPAGG